MRPASWASPCTRPPSGPEILHRVADEYTTLPLIVTETGQALFDYVDPEREINDAERVHFYRSHIEAATEAMNDGVDLVQASRR
nr:family 1 glycosylhydrolase [Leifsonia shinshuensis]